MTNRLFQTAAVAGRLVAMMAPTTGSARYKCDEPVSAIDKRACEQVAESTAALRRFVTPRRTIWELDVYDDPRDRNPFAAAAKPESSAASVADPVTVGTSLP